MTAELFDNYKNTPVVFDGVHIEGGHFIDDGTPGTITASLIEDDQMFHMVKTDLRDEPFKVEAYKLNFLLPGE